MVSIIRVYDGEIYEKIRNKMNRESTKEHVILTSVSVLPISSRSSYLPFFIFPNKYTLNHYYAHQFI